MNLHRSLSTALGAIASTLLLGTLIGVLSSLASITFIEAIYLLNDWFKISAQSRFLTDVPGLLMTATILVPTLGGLIVGFIIWNCTEDRKPQSIADYIADSLGHTKKKAASLRDRFVNVIASLVSLGCGASVGQYGAVAYLGGTIGSSLLKVSGKGFYHNNIAICCGVAAAISTIFNAPIAGIVFAHEVVLRHYSIRAFAPVTVASTAGFVIANQYFNRLPLLSIGGIDNALAVEFVIFAIIGITGALVAQVFMQSILFFTRARQSLRIHPVFHPMLAGLAVGVIALGLPDVMGIGKEAIRLATLEGAFSSTELATLLVMKILLTGLCLGLGFVGGVFSPSVFCGIMFGTLWGLMMAQIPGFERSDLVFYAICGMVAVTSPVIGAPLTTILLVLELTRNYSLTTAAMVSVVISNIVSYQLFGRSLFDKVLQLRGVDMGLGRDTAVLNMQTVSSYISEDFCRLDPANSLNQCRKHMIHSNATEAYMLDGTNQYLGSLTLIDLDSLEDAGKDMKMPAREYIKTSSFILVQGSSIWDAMNGMGDFIGESIPVLDSRESGKMLGVVHESTIIQAYLETTSSLRKEENQ